MAERVGDAGDPLVRVLIIGEGKSGTTALMRSVSDCLNNPEELFEPRLLEAEALTAESLVVKKLLLNWRRKETKFLPLFDKRLLITRDPRDRLISHLLYDAYNQAPKLSQERRDRWLKALGTKVNAPHSLSVSDLLNLWWRISRVDLLSNYVRALDRGVAFQNRTADHFHTIRYETYVDGEFDELNAYLGLNIAAGVVRGSEARVSRSKSSGAWRDWFTQSDVSLFRPMTHRWLKVTGADTQDWAINTPDNIDAETSVDYVRGLFDRAPVPDS